MSAAALVDLLARELARTCSERHGGKGHWSQWEDDHPTEAVVAPLTWHLPYCPERAANHWHPVRGCSDRCATVRAVLADAAAYLGVDVASLRQPAPKRHPAEQAGLFGDEGAA